MLPFFRIFFFFGLSSFVAKARLLLNERDKKQKGRKLSSSSPFWQVEQNSGSVVEIVDVAVGGPLYFLFFELKVHKAN